jgi:C4-dicarboxylate transporter DctM subunit
MMLVLLITLLLLVLILLRVPVAFAILGSGIVGLMCLGGFHDVIGVLRTIPQSAIGNNSLAAIPLFILMAQFVLHSGALTSLFDSARTIIGRVPGGTAFAAVGAGAVFASVSGSSTAAAATLAHTSTGELIRQGYDKRLSSGVVAAAGALAAMIPPSVLLIFYAITAEVAVGPTLIAGIIPGILVAIALIVAISIVILTKRESAPRGEASTATQKLRSLSGMLPIFVIFAAVIGLVFLGITTTIEAAVVGCVGGLILMAFRRTLTWKTITDSCAEALSSSMMILTIIMAAYVFGHFITESQVTPYLVEKLSALPTAPIVTVAVIAFGYLVLGFFMDQAAIIALTVPVTLPVVTELGFDPIWFGIVVILLAEIGLITPPLGLNVFVVARAARMPVETVFRGSMPFVFAILVVGALLFAFPQIVLILPDLMAAP